MTDGVFNISIFVVFGLYIVYMTIFPKNDPAHSNALNLAINMVSAVMLLFLLQISQNFKMLRLFLESKFRYRTTKVRISMSYLFRIEVDGVFLLIKSRTREYFQPVGGAYKSLPGSEVVFDALEVTSDRIYSTVKGIAKGDLRLFVKGKHILPLLNWFSSKKDREISPWREFSEELIVTGILPFKEFYSIDYKFKTMIQTPIMKLDTGELGMYVFDIFDLLPTDDQKIILNELRKKGDTETLIWASAYHISRLGHDEPTNDFLYPIARHAKWAQDLKYN